MEILIKLPKWKVVLIIMCSIILLNSGCASGIKRTGYKLPKEQNAKTLPICPIVIKSHAQFETGAVVVLGHIDAYDNGISVHCDEAYAFNLFAREACALGADIINITEEKQPDFWSTCYRAKAEFLRFEDREKAIGLLSDSRYAPDLIIDRSAKAGARTRDIIFASVMGGLLGGIGVALISAPHGH